MSSPRTRAELERENAVLWEKLEGIYDDLGEVLGVEAEPGEEGEEEEQQEED